MTKRRHSYLCSRAVEPFVFPTCQLCGRDSFSLYHYGLTDTLHRAHDFIVAKREAA